MIHWRREGIQTHVGDGVGETDIQGARLLAFDGGFRMADWESESGWNV